MQTRLAVPVLVLAVAGAGCGVVARFEDAPSRGSTVLAYSADATLRSSSLRSTRAASAAKAGSSPQGDEAARCRVSVRGGPEVALFLLGAREGTDIDEIDVGPVSTEEETPSGKARTRPGRRLAARVGLIVAGGAEDEDREPGLLAGLGYDLPFGGSGSFRLEAGADFGRMSDKSGDLQSDIVVLAGAACYAPGGGGFYVIGGASVLMDRWVDKLSDEEGSSFLPLAEIGLGLRAASGRLDIRASYMMLMGSENVPGLATARLGFVF